MFLIVAALVLLVQDPPPGDVIATAPPRPAAATLPDSYLAPQSAAARPASTVDFAGYAEEVAARDRARDDDSNLLDFANPGRINPMRVQAPGPFDWSAAPGPVYPAAEGGYSRSAARAAAAPLPAEALADPVRYAAQQCRPETRPAGEDVAICFDRIDRAVRQEQDRRAASRRPQVRCQNSQSRDDDRRTSTTSGGCSIGTGDPGLLNRTMGW